MVFSPISAAMIGHGRLGVQSVVGDQVPATSDNSPIPYPCASPWPGVTHSDLGRWLWSTTEAVHHIPSSPRFDRRPVLWRLWFGENVRVRLARELKTKSSVALRHESMDWAGIPMNGEIDPTKREKAAVHHVHRLRWRLLWLAGAIALCLALWLVLASFILWTRFLTVAISWEVTELVLRLAVCGLGVSAK
jgi:hypothetical protein